jgi:hypothetical protein
MLPNVRDTVSFARRTHTVFPLRPVTSTEVGRVLDDLAAVARPVRLAFRWRPKLSDPNDERVLEKGINGSTNAVVIFNQRDFALGNSTGNGATTN